MKITSNNNLSSLVEPWNKKQALVEEFLLDKLWEFLRVVLRIMQVDQDQLCMVIEMTA